jgi:hypothetical protein
MPMPISNLDEYDKVVNVSWFTPDKPRGELSYVILAFVDKAGADPCQISMRVALLSDVPSLLY